MKKLDIKPKKGFTIIEVVLVLAIAALIFLMVFIALPNLQVSQRDTQRRDDLARFSAQITQYSSNNRGKVPHTGTADTTAATTEWTKFLAAYLNNNGDSFVDPDGEAYKVEYKGTYNKDDYSAPTEFKTHTIYVYGNAKCDGETPVASTGERKVAFVYKLEGAGIYCGNN
jgi:prepilin-type N-terminal cleavage/methylation domain-containing protein